MNIHQGGGRAHPDHIVDTNSVLRGQVAEVDLDNDDALVQLLTDESAAVQLLADEAGSEGTEHPSIDFEESDHDNQATTLVWGTEEAQDIAARNLLFADDVTERAPQQSPAESDMSMSARVYALRLGHQSPLSDKHSSEVEEEAPQRGQKRKVVGTGYAFPIQVRTLQGQVIDLWVWLYTTIGFVKGLLFARTPMTVSINMQHVMSYVSAYMYNILYIPEGLTYLCTCSASSSIPGSLQTAPPLRTTTSRR